MRYSPPIGYALMALAVGCFFLGAPPWMFLATGLAAIAVGVVGIRQGSLKRRTDPDAPDPAGADVTRRPPDSK